MNGEYRGHAGSTGKGYGAGHGTQMSGVYGGHSSPINAAYGNHAARKGYGR